MHSTIANNKTQAWFWSIPKLSKWHWNRCWLARTPAQRNHGKSLYGQMSWHRSAATSVRLLLVWWPLIRSTSTSKTTWPIWIQQRNGALLAQTKNTTLCATKVGAWPITIKQAARVEASQVGNYCRRKQALVLCNVRCIASCRFELIDWLIDWLIDRAWLWLLSFNFVSRSRSTLV